MFLHSFLSLPLPGVLSFFIHRVGEFKPLSGLNRLKLNTFMPLAGISSVLRDLNWLKPPVGINQFKPLADTNPI